MLNLHLTDPLVVAYPYAAGIWAAMFDDVQALLHLIMKKLLGRDWCWLKLIMVNAVREVAILLGFRTSQHDNGRDAAHSSRLSHTVRRHEE